MAKLKEICDVDWGNTSLTKSSYVDDGKYLGVSAAGCDGRMDYYDFDAYIPVISAIGANCGKLFLPEEPFVAIKNTITLKPHDGLDGKYLYYALINNKIPKRGGGQPFIGKGDTGEYEIAFPNIETQLEIVEKLERINRIISYRMQEIGKLDELIKARFVEMFGDPVQNTKGWDMPLIEEVVANEKNAIKAGPFGSALKKEYYVESGYKIYGQEQVISGDYTYGDYYIDEERYKSLENCAVQAGDVLISLVGTYGKLLIMPETFEPGIINPRLMKITFDKELVNPYYFKYFFQSESLKKSLSDNTHGGTMDILNLGIVRKIAMPLPPIELQNEFVAFVKQVDKSKVIELAA